MQWFLNDLSLDGQFSSPNEFKGAIEPLLSLQQKEPFLRRQLYCSRSIGECYVTKKLTFRQAVFTLKNRDFKQRILSWVTKYGPFWDDDRQFNPDDYFEYQGADVTGKGLGEAARRCITGINAGTFSFTGSRYNFEITPLKVQQGLTESPIQWIEIENLWTISRLKAAVKNSRPEPQNWTEVIDYAVHDFPELIFAKDYIAEQLGSHPFSGNLAAKIFERLKVLNTIAAETNPDGSLSDKGKQEREDYFVGADALFTDESEENKNRFKQRLTFPDPDSSDNSIFCSRHGKINTPKFRIHFEWPRPSGQKKIKVVYIGPKITKH